MSAQPTNARKISEATIAKASGGTYDGAVLSLYQSGPSPGGCVSLGDFVGVGCDTVFSNIPLTWDTPYLNQQSSAQMDSQRVQMISNGNSPVASYSGYLILGAGNTSVLDSEQFVDDQGNPAPFVVSGPGNTLVIIVSPTFG